MRWVLSNMAISVERDAPVLTYAKASADGAIYFHKFEYGYKYASAELRVIDKTEDGHWFEFCWYTKHTTQELTTQNMWLKDGPYELKVFNDKQDPVTPKWIRVTNRQAALILVMLKMGVYDIPLEYIIASTQDASTQDASTQDSQQ